MKKILFAIVVVAAMSACTKSEVEYDQPNEIGFVPVTKMNTKAAVHDTQNPNAYPTALPMYVFANAGAAEAEVSTYNEVYFKNALFTSTTGVFSGDPTPYYWPNVKKLIFSGVSASGNVNAIQDGAIPQFVLNTYYKNGGNNEIKLTDSEVPEGATDVRYAWEIELNNYMPGTGSAEKGDNDLMWFPTTTPVGKADKESGQELSDGNVDVVMKHACAWVTINIKGNGVTAGENPWNIETVKVLDLVQQATATLGAKATWTSPADGEDLTIFDLHKAQKTSEGRPLTKTGEDYTNKALVTDATVYDLVVIPQAVTKLEVSYNFISQKAAGSEAAIVIDETIPVELTPSGAPAKWEAGYHYTYNITVTTTEILVEPTAATWTTSTPSTDVDLK